MLSKINPLIYIFIIAFLFLMNRGYINFTPKTEDSTEVDSTKITKIIESIKGEFKKTTLTPIKEVHYIDNGKIYENLIKELQYKYSNQVDSTTILKELLHYKKQRQYKETFKDSIINADVSIYTTGTLDSLKFNYTRKEQAIEYYNITTTNKITPDFRVLGGISLTTDIQNATISGNLGVQDKKGRIYLGGLTNNKEVIVTALIPIFTKYKK